MREKSRYKIVHIFGDKVMSDEEFMSKPYVVDLTENAEIVKEAQRLYDPMYAVKERAQYKRELIEKRKQELEEQFERISQQYNSLV